MFTPTLLYFTLYFMLLTYTPAIVGAQHNTQAKLLSEQSDCTWYNAHGVARTATKQT